jgi:hypothetical protein
MESPMSRGSRRVARLFASVAATLPAVLATGPAWAGQRPAAPLSAFDARLVERARLGAARRLAEPGCLRLLGDFSDSEGQPLEERLRPWGVPAGDYLLMIPFLNGDGQPLCRGGRTALAAKPGVPRVYVCPSFARVQTQDSRVAEAMVIHEMLHTLGLGENPPTSGEITARVLGRCD